MWHVLDVGVQPNYPLTRVSPRTVAFRTLPAVDTEVVEESSYATVGIDRNVKIFVHQKIVSVPLADDTKVVDERFLHTYLGVKLVLSHASALILVASCLPYAADPLWLKM